MRILTTGTLNGLGKCIYETLGGIGWSRKQSAQDRKEVKRKGVDVIVHCAFNSLQSVNSDILYSYLADNVLLTEELVSVPHQKFIYLSSVDVYPRGPGLRSENEVITVNAVNGIYGMTKLMSEAIVRRHCPKYLILRCVSLLGKYSRRNSLIRIIEDEPCALTLSGDSRFNYILHSDVAACIQVALKRDIQGIYNVSSNENVTLSSVADMLGKKVKFGAYHYDVGDIDNKKITSILPVFDKTSSEVIDRFIRERMERG